ncbi:RICIN domain-containing protein [Streptomyces violaceoruber]
MLAPPPRSPAPAVPPRRTQRWFQVRSPRPKAHAPARRDDHRRSARRRLPAHGAALPPARAGIGAPAFPFGLGRVRPTATLLDQGDGTCTIRDARSGKLLPVQNDSPAAGAFVAQEADDGAADNRWRILRRTAIDTRVRVVPG